MQKKNTHQKNVSFLYFACLFSSRFSNSKQKKSPFSAHDEEKDYEKSIRVVCIYCNTQKKIVRIKRKRVDSHHRDGTDPGYAISCVLPSSFCFSILHSSQQLHEVSFNDFW